MRKIIFTVTNDLSFDQRMIRICSTLAQAGYAVTLVGRKLPASLALENRNFRQKRLNCLFRKGPLFYFEYNIRLFFFLLFIKMDAVCAIDLDTIIPCLLVSKIKGVRRVYDAHEYFTELKEVHSRPGIKRIWTAIERFAVPRFRTAYTVGEGLAEVFKKQYNIDFDVVRNLPVLRDIPPESKYEHRYLYYQGAVNEGRGFEYLLPALEKISYKMIVAGNGNYMEKLKAGLKKRKLDERVQLVGMLKPDELWPLATNAAVGLALAEKEGLNQFLALPNKFFDYMHAGLPQIAMNYPEYEAINKKYRIALLIGDLDPDTIARAITTLMEDAKLRNEMRENCLLARKEYSWDKEKAHLLKIYQRLFSDE